MANQYIHALREAVGEENFPLALEHMRLAGRIITPERAQELQHAKDNKARVALLDEWCGNFLTQEVKHTIALLAETQQLGILQELGSAEAAREESAVITTAHSLEDETKNTIRTALEKLYDTVTISYTEDPSLIGGIKIRVGDREVDNSIRTKLDKCFA